MFSWDLLANAVVAGLLLGGFYAAVSLGISLIFGLLDIANIAQPAFVILGAYGAYVMNSAYGLDPILTGVLFTPLFYLVGAVALGGGLIYLAIRLWRDQSKKWARTLFWYSNMYLAAIFAIMVLDRVIH